MSLISFKYSVNHIALPERFTFPFYYQAHPLCVLAANELQAYLEADTVWQHNFGLDGDDDGAIGKMFGVLLVQNSENEIGYLAAFSGKIADSNDWPHFVPPVFDMLAEDGFFRADQAVITQVSERVKQLEKNPQLAILKNQLNELKTQSETEIAAHRALMIEARRIRKMKRVEGEQTLNSAEFLHLKEQLSKESIQYKNQLRDLTYFWHEKTAVVQKALSQLTDEIEQLKEQRQALSLALQTKLFEQYQFLNKDGVVKSLNSIFADTTPPAGAGECAAPKLLHYAFKHNLKPLAMAEFWWGASPKSEVRLHQHFYGACQGKCKSILAHMLAGIELDDNPLLLNPAEGKSIDVVYQDDVMVVINKPAEFLSVPGKHIEDSVLLRMQQQFPDATGPLIVHRLDMPTSGLMVIALNKEVNKKLQKQFINRSVKKRYVALLDGVLTEDEGIVNLPLRVDLDDRPRQVVCDEYGRAAETKWQIIERTASHTKVYFYPKTGRTHQLRVHAAHREGLNMPILGDDLYGKKANRLHLHAEFLAFTHPVTKQWMAFQVDAEF